MSTARGAGGVQGQRLGRVLRLRTARDFRRVYQRGRRVTGPTLIVVGLGVRGALLRVGLSVAKEHGPAVRRNKIKRLLREAFRLERPDLPVGFDIVLIPRPSEGKLVLGDLRRELSMLLRTLAEDPEPRSRSRRQGRR
jgi:ribonuclease P protein component